MPLLHIETILDAVRNRLFYKGEIQYGMKLYVPENKIKLDLNLPQLTKIVEFEQTFKYILEWRFHLVKLKLRLFGILVLYDGMGVMVINALLVSIRHAHMTLMWNTRISNGLSFNLLRQVIMNGTVCSRRGLAPFVFQLVQPSMSEWAKYYTFNKLFHVMCYALPYLSRVDTLYGNLIQKIDVLFMTWFSNNLSVFFLPRPNRSPVAGDVDHNGLKSFF